MNKQREEARERAFLNPQRFALLKAILLIAVPVALQTIISVGINMVDTLMVGALGETQLTAVSQASQLFFIFQLTLFGTTGGANVLIAQYWGKTGWRSDPVGDRLYVPRDAERSGGTGRDRGVVSARGHDAVVEQPRSDRGRYTVFADRQRVPICFWDHDGSGQYAAGCRRCQCGNGRFAGVDRGERDLQLAFRIRQSGRSGLRRCRQCAGEHSGRGCWNALF